MKEEVKQIAEGVKHVAEGVAHSPTAGWGVVFITWVQAWWIDWGSVLTDAITSFLGIVLAIILIRYHLHKTANLIEQTKKMRKESEEDN